MKIASLILIISISLSACQKSSGYIPAPGNDPSDSTINAGDMMTYEVITSDPNGWFGVWNDSTGMLTSVGMDNASSGSPNYQPSGWTYSFHCPNKPFQALISVFNFSYSNDVTVNLYKNGTLFKSVASVQGNAKLLVNTITDSLTHTANKPVLKYEVIMNNTDSTDPFSDSWNGSWVTSNGHDNSYSDPLLSNLLPMPSGWNWQFIPDQLPFKMEMGAAPVQSGSGDMTINYYVNGVKVKSITSKDRLYANDIAYVVK